MRKKNKKYALNVHLSLDKMKDKIHTKRHCKEQNTIKSMSTEFSFAFEHFWLCNDSSDYAAYYINAFYFYRKLSSFWATNKNCRWVYNDKWVGWIKAYSV